MLFAVAAAKFAGIASLLILGWIVWRMVRGRGQDAAPAPEAAGPRPDPAGKLLMRGFTLMLILGVGSAFAISFGEVAQAL
jgi:hypothetical protein